MPENPKNGSGFDTIEAIACPVSLIGLESIDASLDRIADALENIAQSLRTAIEELPLDRIADHTERIAGCLSLGLDDLGKIRKCIIPPLT